MVNRASPFSRRSFAGLLGLAGLGAAASALGANASQANQSAAATSTPAMTGMDMSSTPAASAANGEMTSDEMDRMHEEGMRLFPAKTAGLGGQPLDYEMVGDVKVFQLTCKIAKWEYEPGKFIDAWTYNGVVPGPEIRATEGDKVRIFVKNELPQSTGIHWHGLMVPNNMDGVPFMTQPPIKPGGSFTYEFQLREGNAGAHMYHAHHNSAFQVTNGLLGPFIVEPKDKATRPKYDKEYTLVLNDGPIGGFSINGKSFPATHPLTAKKGETILIRYMNEGLMIHPMHLHGMPMTVFAQDGYILPQPYMCDTLNISPGSRYEVLVHATEPGTWAFHCHILSHAESAHGMFGMVTALVVEP